MQNPVEVAQIEMQRHFGRCLLRLQQYERLLKTMVATTSISGHPKELEALQAQQVEEVRGFTLGTLLRLFTRDYLVDKERLIDVSDAPDPCVTHPGSLVYFKSSYTMAMSSEDYEQTVAAMTELRDMRNELVHHFIERFDITDEAACLAGTQHLKSCFAKIDGHLQQLCNWAKAREEARRLALSFLESEEFESMFMQGDTKETDSTSPTILDWLRSAEVACDVNGWTPVVEAVAHISRAHGTQSPSLYGSSTWRELLEKSRQFETKFEKGSSAKPGRTWFRSSTAPSP
jgi:hypothetical protein